ncbi:Fanconi anemia group J protein homolog [Haliotis asinina]|uniref:Fanconi anemia group J protein homolog n=1 Tax=Haliotis asinina TaxID=109174 RepID=UPI0035323F97
MAALAPGHQQYKIGGVSVQFPCKPYPSQFSMMDKIIKGLERQQNCLLESPTGSGKSLALLCSALAWQRAEMAKKDQEEARKQKILEDAENGVCGCLCNCHTDAAKQKASEEESTSAYFPPPGGATATPCSKGNYEKHVACVDDDGDDDDFKADSKTFRTPGTHQPSLSKKLRRHVTIEYDNSPSKPNSMDTPKVESVEVSKKIETVNMVSPPSEDCLECDCASLSASKKKKIPRIYFGTRTHKQVAQIVRELKRTAYHDVNMTILGSREHTCVHPVVSKMANKNDGCKELLKGPGCRMKDRAKSISSQEGIHRMGLTTAWDLEDMVNMCKKQKACPYFLTRALKEQSEIIICPYNYLVDPIIRDTMEINLKDQIIILDEAHNIEDSSREAGSQSLKQELIQKAITELRAMANAGVDTADSLLLEKVMSGLDQFIHLHSDKLEQKDFDQSYKIWSGFDIVAQLDCIGLGPVKYTEAMKSIGVVCQEKDEMVRNAQGEEVKLSPPVMTVLEQLASAMGYLYRDDMKFVEDYRVSIVKTTAFVSNQPTNGAWLNPRQRHGGQRRVPVVTCTLNFWCMNPAVAFSDLQNCRSIVLSSGTLSPMSSFSSELGMNFSIQLEANHVIKDDQVWVGAVGQGPNGTSLQAVYRNVETYNFQDELGQLVFRVCKTVPHGVLCFFPSYKCLEKLTNRWKTTGLWDKMFEQKKIVAEPRGSDKMNFEELMNLFYEAVETRGDEDKDGALFLAVCRGKVSEGLDFADNFARAVITVGIPYPNFKDIQVELKRKYNDMHKAARGLLSGSDWYEIQAFRALNQALGRCIRHRRDWGALIIVDERFVKNPQKYLKGLSKWVRNKAVSYNTFSSAMDSLSRFTKHRIESMEVEEAEASFISSTPCTQPFNESMIRTPLQDKANITCHSMSVHKGDNSVYDSMTSHSPLHLTPDLGFKTGGRMSLTEADINIFGHSGKMFVEENVSVTSQKGNQCVDSNVSRQEVVTLNETTNYESSSKNGGYVQSVAESPSNPKLVKTEGKAQSVLKNGDHLGPQLRDHGKNMIASSPNPKSGQKNKQTKLVFKFEYNDMDGQINKRNDKTLNKNVSESDSTESGNIIEKQSLVTGLRTNMLKPDLEEEVKSNRFFKFCRVPRRDSLGCERLNQSVDDVRESRNNPPTTEPMDSDTARSTSPLLFDGSSDPPSILEHQTATKKPLFKQKSRSDSVEQSTVDSKETHEDHVQEEHGSKGDACDIDELEGLMVKRRSSRQKKRKSDSTAKAGSKRPRGIDFLDDVQEDQDQKADFKQITCSMCGHVLLNGVKNFEKRKRLPFFVKLPGVTGVPDIVYLSNQPLGNSLQGFSTVLGNGLPLDSHCDTDAGVAVQFLHCNKCGDQQDCVDVLGCRILLSTDSQYQKGQMWLNLQKVKMS